MSLLVVLKTEGIPLRLPLLWPPVTVSRTAKAKMKNDSLRRYLLAVLALAGCGATLAFPQQISKFDSDRAKQMLADISADVKKHYYDPRVHGVDWEARVRETREKIDQAPGMNMAMSHVAEALDALNDSHTFFLPPERPYRIEFGYQLQMIGDNCFVTRVRPQSDAEAKGLKPGDQVLALNGYSPTRDNLWKMEYAFRLLRPQPQMTLVVRPPTGQEYQALVTPRLQQLRRIVEITGKTEDTDIFDIIRREENAEQSGRGRYLEVNDELMILKLPVFDFTDSQISDMINKARKHKSLIVDLRGNGGGLEDTLKSLLGGLLDHEVKVGDLTSRASSKPVVAKSKGKNAFAGKLIVLIDSESASASELFARVVQLEKRGTVLGDLSSGSVMRSARYKYQSGVEFVIFYGASITNADVIMVDGKSLEHRGVTPDEILVPAAADLAAGRDPVMVRAAELAGVKLSPDKAGSLFPYEWPKN